MAVMRETNLYGYSVQQGQYRPTNAPPRFLFRDQSTGRHFAIDEPTVFKNLLLPRALAAARPTSSTRSSPKPSTGTVPASGRVFPSSSTLRGTTSPIQAFTRTATTSWATTGATANAASPGTSLTRCWRTGRTRWTTRATPERWPTCFFKGAAPRPSPSSPTPPGTSLPTWSSTSSAATGTPLSWADS